MVIEITPFRFQVSDMNNSNENAFWSFSYCLIRDIQLKRINFFTNIPVLWKVVVKEVQKRMRTDYIPEETEDDFQRKWALLRAKTNQNPNESIIS
jgi:hypothetical protein